MTGPSLDEDSENNRLCSDCIGEAFLSSEVQKKGQLQTCSYCCNEGKTFSLEELADAVELALDEHFYRTSPEPSSYEYMLIKEGDRDWERKGESVADVIAWIAEIESGPAEDIRCILADRHADVERARMGEENPFDESAYYAENGVSDGELQADWATFEQNLKTKARYFSRTGANTLAAIFDGIGGHFSTGGRPVVVDAGPGKELSGLFRARVFQSELKLKHALEHRDSELGPPPTKAAANGRMNALGISVFYGATDHATALAEVRPPVGSRVLVGRFEIILPLRLLEVEALRSLMVRGSVFDHSYLSRLRRAKFLEGLSHRITKPVMPDDEPFEYLATQAIADFLATESNPPLDGLIYPSIQADAGVNVVLFHKAARVGPLDIPPGSTVSADLSRFSDDEAGPDYWVWEEIPPVATTEPSASSDFPLINPRWTFESDDHDERTPTLRLDVTSLEVHHVERVAFATSTHPVHHHRSEKRPLPF